METLIRKLDCQDRWYPISVDEFKRAITIPLDSEENRRLNSNFAYNMQYLQYIEKQLSELKLSSVLVTMLYKSYIITGMGIIELVLTYILKSKNAWNRTEWKEVKTFKSNSVNINDDICITETKLLHKVDSYEMRMDLDSMIKKTEKKNLLTIDHNVFPALKHLRELRNRVHLQSGDDAYDHDYNAFGYEEIQMMRRILIAVLTAPEICVNERTFSFIKEAHGSI